MAALSGGGGGIKSVQRGNTTIAASGITNITIAAVDMSKSFLTFNCAMSFTGMVVDDTIFSARLTSATNIEVTRTKATSIKFAWEVVESN